MSDQNNLSEREIEILKLVATGLTNREIAQELTISPNTVKVHIRNIFEKISVASRTEATIYGIEHGLVDVPGGVETDTVLQPPTQREQLRKYLWIGVPAALLVIGLIVALILNSLRPPPAPEILIPPELAERWRELAPMPAGRAGMAATAYDGEIYAIAGEGPEGVSGSVFRYAPETDTWTQLSDKPTPVADIHGVLIGERIYVPGGRGHDGAPTDILEIYDPRRDAWSAGAPLPQPVSAYALAGFEGQMYLFGGWDGERALDVVYVYDPGADTWQEGTESPKTHYRSWATTIEEKIFILGHEIIPNQKNEEPFSFIYTYAPNRDFSDDLAWEKSIPLNEKEIIGLLSIVDNLFILFNEMKTGTNYLTPTFYSNTNQMWIFLEPLEINNTQNISWVSLQNRIHLIGGFAENEFIKEHKAFQAIYTIVIPLLPQ